MVIAGPVWGQDNRSNLVVPPSEDQNIPRIRPIELKISGSVAPDAGPQPSSLTIYYQDGSTKTIDLENAEISDEEDGWKVVLPANWIQGPPDPSTQNTETRPSTGATLLLPYF